MSDVQFLQALPAFGSVPARAVRQLLAASHRVEHAPGERILRRGDAGVAMYVILRGRVEVPVVAEDGRVHLVAHLGPGDIFGEMALLTGEPRTADVIVEGEEPCACLVFPKEPVEVLLRQHPALAVFLTNLLMQRMRESATPQRIGEYRILSVLGRGGMATVFAGSHEVLDRPVAIKMLSHHLVYRDGFLERFDAEARVLAQLRHPGIVRVFDARRSYGTRFLVMERIRGMDLGRVLSDRGALSSADVRQILRQTARALGHAHECGIVHRDVKPSNLLMESSGRVRVVDFGIADGMTSGAQKDEGILCSPDYAAPELIRGGAVDGRTDIYSLGILAYRMLVGAVPYPARDTGAKLDMHLDAAMPNVRDLQPRVAKDLVSFIARATQKDPADRPQDCAEVEQMLLADAAPGGGARTTTITITHAPGGGRGAAWLVERIRELIDATPQVEGRIEEEGARARPKS